MGTLRAPLQILTDNQLLESVLKGRGLRDQEWEM